MPRKVRQLIAELQKAGFIKIHHVGSHRKFEKNGIKVQMGVKEMMLSTIRRSR